MITKRAVSPLIATVLLVGFTIALGAMISSFLIKQTQENFKPDVIIKDTEFCDSVSIGYIYNQTWTTTGDNKNFLTGLRITNKGSYSITNLTIKPKMATEQTKPIIDYIKSDANNIVAVEGGIKPGKSEEVRFIFNPSAKEDTTVEFIPWIKDYTIKDKNVYIICNDKKLKFNLCDVYKKTENKQDCSNW
jgi:flagellin-like protein